MAIDSTTGPSVSFRGFATGLDSNSIIEALVNVRRVEQTRLEAKAAKIQKQQQAYGTLRAKLASLRSKADGINSAEKLGAATASTTADTTVTATASGAAAEGSYNVVINQLATTGSGVSSGFADSNATLVGKGRLTFESDGASYEVALNDDATLEQIRDAINASDAPVKAAVINDGGVGTPFKLVLTAETTGAAASFTVDTSSFVPVGGALSFATTAGQNAQFSVNGFAVTRTSNTVTDVVPGASFELKQGGGATATVTIARDLGAVKKRITDFVAAYNDVVSEVRTHRSFADRDGKAVLYGESNLERVLGRIKEAATTAVTGTGSATDRLGDLGIRTDQDGKLVVADDQLTEALENDYAGALKLFTQVGSGSGNGLARDVASAASEAITAIILPRTNALRSQTSTVNTRIQSLEERLDKYAVSLRNKYAALETFAGRYQQAGAALGSLGT